MTACRICEHPERTFIDRLLAQGLAPRAICKRIGRTSRRSLTHHRERCLKEERNEA